MFKVGSKVLVNRIPRSCPPESLGKELEVIQSDAHITLLEDGSWYPNMYLEGEEVPDSTLLIMYEMPKQEVKVLYPSIKDTLKPPPLVEVWGEGTPFSWRRAR